MGPQGARASVQKPTPRLPRPVGMFPSVALALSHEHPARHPSLCLLQPSHGAGKEETEFHRNTKVSTLVDNGIRNREATIIAQGQASKRIRTALFSFY